jgi:hypothetical protein
MNDDCADCRRTEAIIAALWEQIFPTERWPGLDLACEFMLAEYASLRSQNEERLAAAEQAVAAMTRFAETREEEIRLTRREIRTMLLMIYKAAAPEIRAGLRDVYRRIGIEVEE